MIESPNIENKDPNPLKKRPPIIPNRIYFRIGDVADITEIKPYVLRFWEKEFNCLCPIKNKSGQRLYRKKDIEYVLLIKRLLYRDRYSIEGAKKRIQELRKDKSLGQVKQVRGEWNETNQMAFERVKQGLKELVDMTK